MQHGTYEYDTRLGARAVIFHVQPRVQLALRNEVQPPKWAMLPAVST
jgi:hypothetical protein